MISLWNAIGYMFCMIGTTYFLGAAATIVAVGFRVHFGMDAEAREFAVGFTVLVVLGFIAVRIGRLFL